MPPPYKLSRTLIGHEQDVRGVATDGDTVLSCSRDGTVRVWPAAGYPSVIHAHTGFVNSIASYPGYVVSGGSDSLIDITKLGSSETELTLVGHGSNVCALAVGQDGTVVSGSWDGTAKLWKDGTCLHTLEGHEGAVWAVLPTEQGILSGGADKTIRLWRDGRQTKNLGGSKDCVRALASHPLGFVSAGNDSVIRIHTFDGTVVQELEGHESFIYQLATTAEGHIFSVGEDRTLRIWVNGKLAQTIAHPAVSVWSVALCNNGDVVTGASDAIVRVFTSDASRVASAADLKAYEDEVAASAIPAQAQNIPNNLPGLEALAIPGSKEGEVKMIRLNGSVVEAHQWTGGVWTKIGEVVGAGPKKVQHEGKDYDFVFDVDIEEGQPPLKLPYNTDQNPYEVANDFINKNELDPQFRDQVVKFIESNTGGIPLGVPKEGSAKTDIQTEVVRQSTLTPQTSCLSMTSGNIAPILKKLATYPKAQSAVVKLDELDLAKASAEQVRVIVDLVAEMPATEVFPALDLLRLSVVAAPEAMVSTEDATTIAQAGDLAGAATGLSGKQAEINTMLSLRSLANILARSDKSAEAVMPLLDTILDRSGQIAGLQGNKNLALALATFLLNVAVVSHKGRSEVTAINALFPMLRLLESGVEEPEAVFRACIALGTAIRISADVAEAAREVFGAPAIVQAVAHKYAQDSRIAAATTELLGLL